LATRAKKKGPAGSTEPWSGGYVLYGQDGRPTYYVKRQVNGTRHEFSTRAHSETAASAHLERFERDPFYRPGKIEDHGKEPVYLDDKLVGEFLAWSRRPKADGGKGNTPAWVAKQKIELAWWAERFVAEDGTHHNLRGLSLDRVILPALDADPLAAPPVQPAPNRAKKIAVLKVLYTYLRKRGRISPPEDPTLAALAVPQAAPSQTKGKVKVAKAEHVRAVIAHLQAKKSIYAHALTVSAATGWHTTEVLCFAETGSIEDQPAYATVPGIAGVLVCPKHKSGKEHRTRVTTEALSSAVALLEHAKGNGRGMSRHWYDTAVRDACKALKIPAFTPANMRHTNATLAATLTGDLGAVGAFLGHAPGSTITRDFYATKYVPPKVPTVLDQPVEAAHEPKDKAS
jgi:integrase